MHHTEVPQITVRHTDKTTQERAKLHMLYFLMGKLQNERPKLKLVDAIVHVKQRNDKGQGNYVKVYNEETRNSIAKYSLSSFYVST